MTQVRDTLDVAVWNIRVRKGKRGTTYVVRWGVAGRQKTATYKTWALADGFRSALLQAARRGEPFDIVTGMPRSMVVEVKVERSWFDLACAYVDLKWPAAAAKSRAGVAETMATLAPVLTAPGEAKPPVDELRRAMYQWACVPQRRRRGPPEELAAAASWLERRSDPVAALADPAVLRSALDTLASKQDGTPVAASTYRRKRAVFHCFLEYAVEVQLLAENPLSKLKRAAPKIAEAVDPRVLIDRDRAEALFAALAAQGIPGRRLIAFFGCLYYAGLRPSEAVALRRDSLTFPTETGAWGEIHLDRSTPAAGRTWTDSGTRRDVRQLKHRAHGDVRIVPCHPRLVDMLRSHLDEFGTALDGRVFRGARGGPLSEGVYGRAWALARQAALSPAEAASSMAARPYDLRHACVTTWLNATGDPAQVAAWAGHSVNVLLRVYVRCVAGRDEVAKQLIERAFGG